jgi:lysine 2,3-aminomutase
VLLKGINDESQIIKTMYQKLLKNRVRPYILYICDNTKGTSHFRTTIEKGIEIINEIGGWTSGLAVPKLIVDTPNGKVQILDNKIAYDCNNTILKTYTGEYYPYD